MDFTDRQQFASQVQHFGTCVSVVSDVVSACSRKRNWMCLSDAPGTCDNASPLNGSDLLSCSQCVILTLSCHTFKLCLVIRHYSLRVRAQVIRIHTAVLRQCFLQSSAELFASTACVLASRELACHLPRQEMQLALLEKPGAAQNIQGTQQSISQSIKRFNHSRSQ